MKLIVGLGNPGPEYKNTRHNAGFMVVEELARQLKVKKEISAHQAIIARAQFKAEPVLIAKPMTYMNLSGQAVRSIMNKYKITIPELLVVSDDMDLELGRLRMKPRGGSGGQKGMQSIIEILGTDDFARLRMGIGRPHHYNVVDYVLTRFDPAEEEVFQAAVKRAADALTVWLVNGIDRAMNKYN